MNHSEVERASPATAFMKARGTERPYTNGAMEYA
jgi:hypothetical protein